jgi:hypothetical protein
MGELMKRIANYIKSQSWKWISITSVLLGLATMSPAPIKDPESKKHELPQHTAQQRQQELKYNGVVGAVGDVPAKTNEDGTGVDPVAGDSTAKSVVSAAPLASDRNAVRALREAGKRIKEQEQPPRSPWLTACLIFLVCAGVFQGLKFWLERNGPAPKKRSATFATSKVLSIATEDDWS